jgi:hypothetical protein
MPREVFVWVEDRRDNLTLSLVQQGFYPAAAFQDMVARDQEFRATQERTTLETGMPIDKRGFEFPVENQPRRLVSDADYADRVKQASTAETDARRLQRGIWSDRKPQDENARKAEELSAQMFPAADLYISGTHAHRIGDPDIYCLLGGVACELGLRVPSLASGEIEFVQHWLKRHPHAQAVPISAANHKRLVKGPLLHSTYIWIEDQQESLNIELIRNGFYWANSLEDMLAYDQHRMAEMDDPRLATADAELRKEREETGVPLRLVSDADYATRMSRAVAAEREAERRKTGVWSDAQVLLWRPPSDEQLIAKYRKQKASFSRIASLLAKDERLMAVNWDPKSWAAAARAGVSQADIDAYARLLRKLGVNQDLTGVVGLGRLCLITTDIIDGIFDTGIIKGYVFSPADPHPLIDDLEHRDELDLDATTTYRKIEDGWYLFELVH